MNRRKSTHLPTTQAWALFLLALLLPTGLYFGFHAISVPLQTPADQAGVAVKSQCTISPYPELPEIDHMLSRLTLSHASWLVHQISESWFWSILFALVFILMLILVATFVTILPTN
ncbi:MAG: hypothetical protein ACFFBR_11175 [Promethearchaeota archaeon]